MNLTGQQVYRMIDARLESFQAEQAGYAQIVNQQERIIRDSTELWQQAYIDLVQKGYLPELSPEAIARTLPQMRASMQAAYDRKQQERKGIEDKMERLASMKPVMKQELEQARAALDSAVRSRDGKQCEISDILESSAEYAGLRNQLQRTQAELAVYQAGYDKAMPIQQASLEAFHSNKRFMFLKGKYNADASISLVDRIGTRNYNYKENRNTYDWLVKVIGEMDGQLQAKQDELAEKQRELSAYERKVAAEAGLTAVRESVAACESRRNAITDGLAEIDSEYRKLAIQRQGMDNTRDQAYTKAVGAYRDYLQSLSIERLIETASATPSRTDDLCVDNIVQLNKDMATAKQAASDAKESRDSLNKIAQKVDDIKRQYRANAYDGERSRFVNINMDYVLNDLVAGQMSVPVFMRMLMMHHQEEPEPVYIPNVVPSPSAGGHFGPPSFTGSSGCSPSPGGGTTEVVAGPSIGGGTEVVSGDSIGGNN